MGLTWDKTNLAEVYWKKGYAEGIKKGIEQGLAECQRKKVIEIARNLLKEK